MLERLSPVDQLDLHSQLCTWYVHLLLFNSSNYMFGKFIVLQAPITAEVGIF